MTTRRRRPLGSSGPGRSGPAPPQPNPSSECSDLSSLSNLSNPQTAGLLPTVQTERAAWATASQRRETSHSLRWSPHNMSTLLSLRQALGTAVDSLESLAGDPKAFKAKELEIDDIESRIRNL